MNGKENALNFADMARAIAIQLLSILVPSHRLGVIMLLSSSCRATIEVSCKACPVFIAALQLQTQIAVAGLPQWIAIAHAMLAKFKAFSFPVN